jgi:hypothetical protein
MWGFFFSFITINLAGHLSKHADMLYVLRCNDSLQGLTGLLQSPIRGAEKHGLPGVISGTTILLSIYIQFVPI